MCAVVVSHPRDATPARQPARVALSSAAPEARPGKPAGSAGANRRQAGYQPSGCVVSQFQTGFHLLSRSASATGGSQRDEANFNRKGYTTG